MTTTGVDAIGSAQAVVDGLRSVHATGRTRSLEWREQQLAGITRLVEEQEQAIAQAIEADLGRNAVESWLGEIASTRGEADFARKRVRRWMRRRRTGVPLTQQPASGWVQYEPLGVVLVIGPWNYPVYLTLSPLVAAVAAGNCAVLKPSEHAPRTSALLAELVPQYLDPEAVRVVEGDADTTQALLAAGFDHVLFTGGTNIGSKIMAGAAPTLTPVTLELGGKSPVIVASDADLAVVARRLLWVKLLNAGQTCIAPDYVIAHRSIRDALVAELIAVVAEFRQDEPDAMRVIDARQHQRLSRYLANTRGEIVLGGGVDPDALTIEATIVVDPHPDDDLMQEEIFGPVLPVIAVDSLDEAAAFVNARPKPLAVYVFSKSRKRAKALVDAIPAGGAVINHVAMHCLVPSMPFGGVGASGMGAYHGQTGFETMSHRKSVLAKTMKFDLRFIYPPYSERTLKLFRKVF
ncbi:aldehyde dehydrogenase family protein [Nocardioides marmoriginsengisoli]|uniref:Aldehyde dehydrogenase n=1 Tax=Nocardioides marmoriginsengisoli TaxID=661483 RepID=A0A3N0CIJ0_9ACTN|nr:aldehyde dehydrogenase family protein [Nocardioides marmoriginsengisoli]RNL62763.1 aldehyde dehydrogenase family protein [Nocardioides marmoriginsengisoli]